MDFNGDDPVYSYETKTRTYYTPVVELSSEEDIMVPAYREVTVYLPIRRIGYHYDPKRLKKHKKKKAKKQRGTA